KRPGDMLCRPAGGRAGGALAIPIEGVDLVAAAATAECYAAPELHVAIFVLQKAIAIAGVSGAHLAVEIATFVVVRILDLRRRRARADHLPRGTIGGKTNADQDVVERRRVAAAFEQEPRAGVAHRAAGILRDLVEPAKALPRHARKADAVKSDAQHVEPFADDSV